MGKIFLIVTVCIILISIAVTDARQKKIPNALLGMLFLCALVSWVLFPEISWKNRIAGAVLVSAILLLVIWIRPGAFGAGDVKLMSVSGMMIGLGKNLTALVFAVVLSALYCLIGMMRGTRKMESEIAFGPFLCAGIILSIFWGEIFIRWYIS